MAAGTANFSLARQDQWCRGPVSRLAPCCHLPLDSVRNHKGERYLVYARENNGILATNHCSKSRRARDKDGAEIDNLRRLHRLPSSILTGTYVVPAAYGPNAPLVGANVTLTSSVGQRFTTKTDAEARLPSPAYHLRLTKFNSTLRLATSWIGLQIPLLIGAPAKELYPPTNAKSLSPSMRVATLHTVRSPTVAFPVLPPLHEENYPNPFRFVSGQRIMSTQLKILGRPSMRPAPVVLFRSGLSSQAAMS